MGGTELNIEFRKWRNVTVMHLSIKPPGKSPWGQERIFTIQINLQNCEGPQSSESSSPPLKWTSVIIT